MGLPHVAGRYLILTLPTLLFVLLITAYLFLFPSSIWAGEELVQATPAEHEIVSEAPLVTLNETIQIFDSQQPGWSENKIQQAFDLASQSGTATFMVLHKGELIATFGDPEKKYNAHSIRKSFLSALIGQAIERGEIDLSKNLNELEIDDNPPKLTATEKTATVADLLKARSGIYHSAAFESPPMKAARPERGSHQPGSFWHYNNWDFNALGTIYENATKRGIFEAFEDLIATPIAMQDFKPSDGRYLFEPESIHPAYRFKLSTRDLAQFGQLFLQNGNWAGKQIIPESWIKESTVAHTDFGNAGYGYMWWTGSKEGFFPNVQIDEPAYYAAGSGGHFLVVIPGLDLVFVHRANTFCGGRSVDINDIGMLLRLVLEAEGETNLGPVVETTAANKPTITPLSASDLRLLPGEYQTEDEKSRVSISSVDGALFLHSEDISCDSVKILSTTTGTFIVESPTFRLSLELERVKENVHAIKIGIPNTQLITYYRSSGPAKLNK